VTESGVTDPLATVVDGSSYSVTDTGEDLTTIYDFRARSLL